jgi:hypothetical protein
MNLPLRRTASAPALFNTNVPLAEPPSLSESRLPTSILNSRRTSKAKGDIPAKIYNGVRQTLHPKLAEKAVILYNSQAVARQALNRFSVIFSGHENSSDFYKKVDAEISQTAKLNGYDLLINAIQKVAERNPIFNDIKLENEKPLIETLISFYQAARMVDERIKKSDWSQLKIEVENRIIDIIFYDDHPAFDSDSDSGADVQPVAYNTNTIVRLAK